MPLDTLLCISHVARGCRAQAAEHNWWGYRQGSPNRFFLLWGVPTVLIVLITFEIEDSVKEHPFFLQIANGKSNFSKTNKKCIEIDLLIWLQSSMDTQYQICIPKLAVHGLSLVPCNIAADHRKHLQVRN